MFLKLFLIQKEAGGRVCFLKKVFSSLGESSSRSLGACEYPSPCALLACAWHQLGLSRDRDKSLVLACIGLTQIVLCEGKMPLFSAKIPKRKL